MAATVLLVMSIAIGAIAVGAFGYGLVFPDSTSILIGVVVAVVAALHAVAALGLWRARVWASWVGLAIAVVGLGAAVLTVIGSLNTGSSIADPNGQLQPWVDARGLLLAVAGGAGYALVLWAVLEGIISARGKAHASTE